MSRKYVVIHFVSSPPPFTKRVVAKLVVTTSGAYSVSSRFHSKNQTSVENILLPIQLSKRLLSHFFVDSNNPISGRGHGSTVASSRLGNGQSELGR